MSELVNLNLQLWIWYVFFMCEHETAFNFCGTSWVRVSIFVFHNLLFTRLDGCPCVLTTTT